ncbi:serine protease [Nesidiocoris tenuis]|uniref:Serine protease n=1 Tax=Nesidiocoris tenuis TaxID=355587 RepID=A0ABN7ABA0_9HEMI|nr:serine protease [Nesidiocoris tenuis]
MLVFPFLLVSLTCELLPYACGSRLQDYLGSGFARATTKRTYNAIEEPDRSSSSEDRELATGLGPRLGTTHKPQFPADPFNAGKNKLEKTSQEKKPESRAEKWCKRNTEGCTSFKNQVAFGLRPRIIGGRAATPKKHTFMVLIGYGSSKIRHWLCGGSLLSSRYVLTAAHCTVGGTLGKAKWVRVGELDLSSNTDDAKPQDKEIAERIRHPDYKEPAVYNDIALLRLGSDVIFNEWVKPICLYAGAPEPEPNNVIVTGWGRTDFASETSPMLLEVKISLFNNSACVGLMGRTPDKMRLPRGIDAGSMVCAGDVNGGKDACTGDSGGPLFVEEDDCVTRQLGITSLGKDCGIPGTAGIYTNVTKYIPWIESIVWSDEE